MRSESAVRPAYARATSAPLSRSPARMLSARDCLNSSGCSARSGPKPAWNSQARSVRKVSSASGRVGYAESTAAPARSKTVTDDATTSATSWSTSNAPPRSTDTATRSPVRVPVTGGANQFPGSPSAVGTRGSGPAITERSSARSPTLRASGPPTAVVSHRLSVGHDGTRPSEGRRPTTPQNNAGLRSDPPMSEPSASGTIPDASAQAAPPDEPPADLVGSTGLSVVPNTLLKVCEPAANSGTLVLPITTTPAPRTRSTSRSSASGTWSAKSGDPYVVRHPATSWVSLNANGRPCRGPSSAPFAWASSAPAAPSRARSSSSETIALSSGLRSAIRARCRSSSSRAEISLRRTADAWSRAVESTVTSISASPAAPEDRAGHDTEQHQAGADDDALDEVVLRADATGLRRRDEDTCPRCGGLDRLDQRSMRTVQPCI